jgi:acetyl esterase/lipase
MASPQNSPQPLYPLHDSVKDLLDPEYINFYNKYLLDAPQVHYQPVAASRSSGRLIPVWPSCWREKGKGNESPLFKETNTFQGGTENVPVGKTIDAKVARKESLGEDVPVRVFVPQGTPPLSGWPVFLWYHGGGWVLGNIDTENSLCTRLCTRANCLVITTDYRLAPENSYPAAVHDAWETVLWVATGVASSQLELPLNLSKLCLGGSSAGGNLAAVMTQKALQHKAFIDKPGFQYQILVVPVTDNTAGTRSSPSYKAFENTAALPAEKMMWYRRHYLPNESDWESPEVSPLLVEAETFAKLPPALVVVAGLDVLRWEGEEYARRMKQAGVDAEIQVMEAVPHPFIVMDAVLQKGRDGVELICNKLAQALK